MPSRRSVIAGAGGAVAAGGLGLGVASQVRVEGVDAVTPPPDTWPMERYDAPNRGTNPAATAPRDPTVDWTTQPVNAAPLALVVGPDAVYAKGEGFAALSRNDGRTRWRQPSTPGALAVYDGTVYAGREGTEDTAPRLHALDTVDGTERWSVAVDGAGTHLVVGDGTLLLGGSHTVTALSLDGTRRWTQETRSVEGGPAVHEGVLYVAAARVRRHDPRTHLDRMRGRLPEPSWETSYVGHAAPPAVDRGTVVAVNERYGGAGVGPVVGVDAAGGSVAWSALATDEVVAHSRPVLAAGRVVVGRDGEDGGRVVALAADDGSVAWRRDDLRFVEPLAPATATTGSARAVGVGDAVVVGTAPTDGEGSVVALDLSTGETRWRVALDARVSALAPVDGTVFAATEDGRVVAIR